MIREMAAGLIIKDKKILLVHNAKHGLRIEPPGGKKNEDEGWLEAVIREVYEELAIKVSPSKLFGEYETHSPEGEFIVRMYFCDIKEGEPKIIEPEKIPSFGWYSFDELEGLKDDGTLVPNMVSALPRLEKYMV